MPGNERYLLIKAWGAGFWSDTMHVAGQLLIAEITGRIPVVYWGVESLYHAPDPYERDAFGIYFEPVSGRTIEDLSNPDFTYFPRRWNANNLRTLTRFSLDDFKDFSDIKSVLEREEDVLVNDVYLWAEHISPFLPEGHPAYGKNAEEVNRYLFQKYFKPSPAMQEKVDSFYRDRMSGRHPVIGAHIRGSDKVKEYQLLHEVNRRYPERINQYLQLYPNASIYIMTDEERILSEYKERYGDRLIYTGSMRTPNEAIGVHELTQFSREAKGWDIVQETFLALRCDHFLGNYASNVTKAISWLKNWEAGSLEWLNL
ncbi:hypothetical protein [Paenibacillus caui]|uniref:hypothetical protein n=1 Tax=Paenibacillus caui TaxID=2873927 RepID=UPI001CA8200E|nr:hypothetical protein [Paenibacillus caui]